MPVTRSRGTLGEIFAVAHRPQGPVAETGILLLPPLGYEDTSSYRPLRVLADLLAERGHLVLRIDWPGLGDSAGAALDPDIHPRRLTAARAGSEALRDAGCSTVMGIGVRAGGLLAMAAGGFDELVLWGAPRNGKRYLRELRAFHRLAAAAFGEVQGAPLPQGAVEAGGFVHGPDEVQALTALDATTLPHTGLRRALVIGRDGFPPHAALLQALRAGGADIEERPGEGLGGLLENAYHADLSAPIRDAILAWAGTPSRTHDGHVRLASELDLGGVRERPWLVEGTGGTLSGVICEPTGGAAPNASWQVFFNAGGIRRCGPNRLWTRTARALARAGRPSLRFDVRDVGDSDGASEPFADLEAMYAPRSIEDALCAIDWVRDQGAPSVDVAGLCSGAFLGAQVCARTTIRRAVLFNCLAFVWDDDARASSMTAHVRGSLFDGRRWRRLLTGKIDAFALARAIKNKAQIRVGKLLAGSAGEDPVQALLTHIVAKGTDLKLVSSEGDPSVAYLESHVPAGARPPLTLIPGADHTIRPVQLHPRVVELIRGQ